MSEHYTSLICPICKEKMVSSLEKGWEEVFCKSCGESEIIRCDRERAKIR